MIYNKYKFFSLLFVVLIVINFTGCFYSFTGASVATHLKSVAIPVVDDRSGLLPPGLKESFTNKLIQRFIQDNTLQVAEKKSADALLESTIVSFNDSPAVVSANENVSSRRVTISVRVLYKDLVKKKTISEKNYSNYGDYDSQKGDVTVQRRAAIESAIDNITDDILIGTVSNW